MHTDSYPCRTFQKRIPVQGGYSTPCVKYRNVPCMRSDTGACSLDPCPVSSICIYGMWQMCAGSHKALGCCRPQARNGNFPSIRGTISVPSLPCKQRRQTAGRGTGTRFGGIRFSKRVVFFQNPDQFFRNDDHPVPVPFGFWYDQGFCLEAEVFKFYQPGFLGTKAAAEQKPEIHGNL